MKPATHAHHRPTHRPVPRRELPPLTWPAPLDALPPLGAAPAAPAPRAAAAPGWPDTRPMTGDTELFEAERGTAFEESLNGLQVRELIGSRLFERLFGPR